MQRTLCNTVIVGLLAGMSCVASAGLATAAPIVEAARSGVDVGSHDSAVRAQDDFFRYSLGKWLNDVEIPADRASWGAFNIAQDNVEKQILALVEKADQDPQASADGRKIGDYYASFIDEKRRNALGLAPLKAELAGIAALRDTRQLAALIAHFTRIGVGTPLNLSVGQDNRNATRTIVNISQSGLGMPNRDYFLALDDAKLAATRAKYQAHVQSMLALAGHEQGATEAANIVALETEIARAQWSAVENRDPVKAYNKLDLAALNKLMPGFDWPAYLKGTGVQGKVTSLIVSQPSYLGALDAIMHKTPLAAWQSYFTFRLLSSTAPFLSQPFVDESFGFRGVVLSGAKVNRPLQQRAIGEVNRAMGEAVGAAYVKAHFPAERKRQVEAMVKNFLAAFKDGIATLDWMSPETKQQAQVKLSKIGVKVGYPDKWRDYSALKVARADLLGNVMRARAFAHEHDIAKLGKPVDRLAWEMTPQTVNAYYSPEMNEIVFPAARLQYPLYDPNAEPAINYGAVGISIGHEISHAFDDQGAQYDGDGNLRNWWTKEDSAKFAARGKVLVAQYGAYSPLPGYFINGELTLGENIADNAGAVMASRAYRISQGGKEGPVIDGFSAEQRLFMGLAQARRGKAREPSLIAQVKSDPHSPAEFRVNGSMRNHPGFYQAFDVKPGDKMYLPPEQRVIFW
ncbi:M13 family metallopeptidase [Massilia sp. TSP1-1-2]|uniref:M13 family metallopeptidase n=1 Tax=Massilia sp. TSP1-1-2 TaxID=2804649 RepID=UPI003CE856DE